MNVLEMLIVVLLGVFGMLSAGLPVNELVQRAKDAFAAEQSRLPPK
jgi:4-hydroxybenzoate polyprenyltransferase